MDNIANQILSYSWVIKILDHPYAAFLYGLNSGQVWILIMVLAVLILYIAYRKLGSGAFFGLLLIFGVAYIVYSSDLLTRYAAEEQSQQESLKLIEAELEK